MKKIAFTTIACLALSGIMLNAATIKGKHTEEDLMHTASYQEIEEEAPQNDPLNAVVRIEAVSTVPSYALPWQNLMPQSCSGSGVVIEGNHILTNAHNLADSTLITVRKQNEDTLFVAKVKFVDHECDLALLSVDDPNFFTDITPMEFAETPPPQSMVIAAGFPMGGDGLSLTQGIISRIEVREYAHSDKDLLTAQIDASINPGNSGGPVLYEGRVVGIAFQGNKQGESLGYMIPYEIIRHFFDDIKDGKVDGFGNLGFLYMPLDNPDTRAFLKMKPGQTGILVRKVYKEFGSDVLQAGDVILSIDGKKVANNGNIRLADGQPRSFSTLISAKQVGESVNVELLRDGNVLNSDMLVQKTPDKIEPYLYDRHPEYFISGGLVFTRLTFSYLLAFGKNYPPFEIIEKYREMKDSPDDNVVVLTQVLGDEVNVGYQNLDAMVLESINGQKVHNLREVTEMVENCKEEYITFEFEGDVPITLNTEKMRNATPNILERYRIPSDRYFESAVENQDSEAQSFEISETVTRIGNANSKIMPGKKK